MTESSRGKYLSTKLYYIATFKLKNMSTTTKSMKAFERSLLSPDVQWP